jgi:hypothetical protein
MTEGYDFGTIYGMADFSGGILVDKGTYHALVESSDFGRTRDGTKSQWQIKARITVGQYANVALNGNITISPKKNDGTDNGVGIAIMFRELAALGIPVPDPKNPASGQVVNGQAPFWVMGWGGQQVAQAMVGRPCQIAVSQGEGDSGSFSRIDRFLPPTADSPTTMPAPAVPNAAPGPQGWGGGQPQGPPPQQQPQWQAPQGQPPAQQWGQPGQPQPAAAQQPPWAAQGPPQGQQPWQGQQPAQAPAGPPQGQWGGPAQAGPPMQPPGQAQPGAPAVPGAPPWAQPAQPGQGGMGEFTGQGQSVQPGTTAPPPWNAQQPPANGAPQQPAQPQQDPAAPPRPPWAQ